MTKASKVAICCGIALLFILVLDKVGYPVAASYFLTTRDSATARVAPKELTDLSVSTAKGTDMSYAGYAFSLPWTELDQVKDIDQNGLRFRAIRLHSGMQVNVFVMGAGTFFQSITGNDLWSNTFHEILGPNATDYDVYQSVYEITPGNFHHWTLSNRLRYRETLLYIHKSLLVSPSASSGIFRVHNDHFNGFQVGNPSSHATPIEVRLFSEKDGVEFTFDKGNANRITQAEINRVIQTLHKVE
jgi:hypothetical protein